MTKRSTVLAITLAALLAAAAAIQTVRLYRVEQVFERAAPFLPDDWEARARAAENGTPGEPTVEAKTNEAASVNTQDPPGVPASPEDDVFERLVSSAIESMMTQDKAGGSDRGNAKTSKKGADAQAGDDNADGTARPRSTNRDKLQTKNKRGESDPEVTVRSAEHSKRLLSQAREAMDSGQYDTAGDLFAQAIESDPTNKQAYRALAQLQHNLGMFQDEVQTYRDWMQAMPDDALPHYLLASTYEGMGLNAEAYQELSAFQSINEGNLSSYPMAASMLRRLGMRAEEVATLHAWAAAAPDSPDVHRALGDFYRRAGDYNLAVAEYQTATGLLPGNISAYISLGSVYTRMGLYAEAQAQYLTVLDLRPDNLSVRTQLAESYRASGNLTGAFDMYQSIIDMQPNSPQAQQAARAITRLQRQLNP